MLLGNKSDSATRQVQSQDGESLAKVWIHIPGLIPHRLSLWIWPSSVFVSDSTGVQLWVHGVQRRHRQQCDSVVGSGGQVTRQPRPHRAVSSIVWTYMFSVIPTQGAEWEVRRDGGSPAATPRAAEEKIIWMLLKKREGSGGVKTIWPSFKFLQPFHCCHFSCDNWRHHPILF